MPHQLQSLLFTAGAMAELVTLWSHRKYYARSLALLRGPSSSRERDSCQRHDARHKNKMGVARTQTGELEAETCLVWVGAISGKKKAASNDNIDRRSEGRDCTGLAWCGLKRSPRDKKLLPRKPPVDNAPFSQKQPGRCKLAPRPHAWKLQWAGKHNCGMEKCISQKT